MTIYVDNQYSIDESNSLFLVKYKNKIVRTCHSFYEALMAIKRKEHQE